MEWINIMERKPPENKRYLVLTNAGATRVLEWRAPSPGGQMPNAWRSVAGWCELPEIPEAFSEAKKNKKTAEIRKKLSLLKFDLAEICRKQEEFDKRIKRAEAEIVQILNEICIDETEEEKE